jgi:LysM repeat protein
MIFKLAVVLPFVLLTSSLGATDQEYEQVRQLALRDPKVQAAFDKANKTLEAKIVEIDPSLAGRSRKSSAPALPPSTPPSRSKNPQPRVHALEKGETLGAVANKYGCTVAELKKLNHIVDDRKLAVGQALYLPKARPVKTEREGMWGPLEQF